MNTKSLYIASMEANSGKLLVTLGIMNLLTHRFKKVAFFRPIIDVGIELDNDIELIRKQYCAEMNYQDCYAFNTDEVKTLASEGRLKELYETLLNRVNALYKRYDFVLCEGLNSPDFMALLDSDINLDIAKNLNIPFVAVINASQQHPQEITKEIKLAESIIAQNGCTHFASFVNRVPLNTLEAFTTSDEETLEYLNSKQFDTPYPVFLLAENDELDKITLADIKKALNADTVLGSTEDMHRVMRQIKVATMTVEHFLSYIEDGDLIIVGGDRADILLAAMNTLSSPDYPNIAGILLTGGIIPEDNLLTLLQGAELAIPILSVTQDSYTTSQLVSNISAEISFDNPRKIALGLGHFEAHVAPDSLIKQYEMSEPALMTPIMFEHELFARAKAQHMNIVLPESSDARILRAVEILLRRQVVDITLLGKPKEILSYSASLGLDIQQANIIDPTESEHLSSYITAYYELRKHKGMTLEGAADAMTDVSFFATMMIHSGHADGMVSGAIHTTANTIRPALQIIKTPPGISVVSSVFLMCLDTQVLVYGDCAINPDPDAAQLAEIAISSADTARMFGIKPKVAMLSYSTGASGKGDDVDKVREATVIVQTKRPDLLVEGPIQYDAAISPDVAKTKLPDSQVAGHATVFIFPDLNAGNNTYKAVQRSSGAVAIGPVIQGLNKPVNDLSRGCLVADIVNTVAITAIQAQALLKPTHLRQSTQKNENSCS